MTTATPTSPQYGGKISTIDKSEALLNMDGISADTINAHWKLYEGYVAKWNDIQDKIASADKSSANQIYSDWRAYKTDLTFAIGGVKNHQVYFENLGGDGAAPTGALGDAITAEWGSYENFLADLKATALAGRGWAFLAYDWETGKLGTYIGDAQNTFPVWNSSLLLALDVYEHAYFADFGTDRGAYIDAYFKNLDWAPSEDRWTGMGMDQNSCY